MMVINSVFNFNSQTLGHCVCTSGFTGPDCSQTLTVGAGLWRKVLADLSHPNVTVSHVARLGHSMVHGPGYLLVFAGYSTSRGLLDDILSFNITSNTWSVIEVNQLPSDVPSARYLHSAVFHGVSNWMTAVCCTLTFSKNIDLRPSLIFGPN